MKELTFEEIKAITFGAVQIRPENGGLRMLKCTDAQIDAWVKLAEWFRNTVKPATGVRLDFHTDSDVFGFEGEGGKFEILIDGGTQGQFDATAQEGVISLPLPAGEHRVTLLFPFHDIEGILKKVVLSDGAAVTAHKYDRKFLFIGDSITQGWKSDYDSLCYVYRTAEHFNADFIDYGVGGGYYHPSVFEKFDYDPEVIFLANGTNDFGWFKTLDEMRTNVKEYLDLVANAYAGKPIFYIMPTWRADEDRPKEIGTFAQVRDLLREAGEEHGFTIIDGYDLIPHTPYFFQDDGLHPNSIGFGMMADNLIARMEKKQ